MGNRWFRFLGPPVAIVVGAVGLLGATSGGTAGRSVPLPDCGFVSADAGIDVTAAASAGAAWYRLDGQLDELGALAGQRLELGLAGGATWTVDLPPESFASGPVGRLVLVGDDDGARSRLRLIDAGSGCAAEAGEAAAVVRSAVLDPAGSVVYEHRVDRVTRADLGIWRRALGGEARLAMEPPAADPEVGLVWSTPLFWSLEGDRLATASCGIRSCGVRWLEPATGRRGTLPGGPVGEPIGLARHGFVGYAHCAAMPCPIEVTDLRTGTTRHLAHAAGTALLIAGPSGPRLVHETGDANLRIVDVVSAAAAVIEPPRGVALVGPRWRAGGGLALAGGEIALDEAGRPDGLDGEPRRLLLDLPIEEYDR